MRSRWLVGFNQCSLMKAVRHLDEGEMDTKRVGQVMCMDGLEAQDYRAVLEEGDVRGSR